MGVQWIYHLRREELVEKLDELAIDSRGTVRKLRQRCVAYVKAHPEIHILKPDPMDYDEKKDIKRDEDLAAA